jgi:hypothetical protein
MIKFIFGVLACLTFVSAAFASLDLSFCDPSKIGIEKKNSNQILKLSLGGFVMENIFLYNYDTKRGRSEEFVNTESELLVEISSNG